MYFVIREMWKGGEGRLNDEWFVGLVINICNTHLWKSISDILYNSSGLMNWNIAYVILINLVFRSTINNKFDALLIEKSFDVL